MGAAFIQYAFGATGDTCNLPGGCTPTALGSQFTCMASVGSKGCGFEHQLESVYAALTTSNATNSGFVRDGALLAVVFVTNEDDGSAPPSASFYSNDTSYGAYTTYRQTHFGVSCGSPPESTPEGSSNGSLMSCEGTPNTTTSATSEYDISRYMSLFTNPGKLKPNPATDIILVGIDAPTTPFETILATAGTGNGAAPNPSYVPCSSLSPPSNTQTGACIVAFQHSCQNTAQPAFFGDPPTRLDKVIKNQPLNTTANICGSDLSRSPDYTSAMQSIANLIVSALKPSCLSAPIKSVPDSTSGSVRPDCVVEDVTSTSLKSLPYCPDMPSTYPCWEEKDNTECPVLCDPTTQKYVQPGITINRNGQMAPDGTTAQVSCNTIALANEGPYAACGGVPDGGIMTSDGG